MKKIASICVISVCAMWGQQTLAADGQAGWYAGASLGRSTVKDDVSTANLTSYSRDSHTAGGKVFAGYRLNESLSIEGAYTDFGKEKFSYTSTGVTGAGDVKVSGITLAAVGRLPVNDTIGLFGKLGGANMMVKYADNWTSSGTPGTTSGRKSSFVPMLGLGVDIALSNSLKLRAEYEAYGKAKIISDSNLGAPKVRADLLSVGLEVRF